jgi:hypothetical protein
VVAGILCGHKRKHPTTNKKANSPRQYFSVFALIQSLSVEPRRLSSRTFPLSELRDRTIVLLALDTMARASDLASIIRDSIAFHDSHMVFEFEYLKQATTRRTTSCTVARAKDTRTCSVASLEAYILRTSDLVVKTTVKDDEEFAPCFLCHDADKKRREKAGTRDGANLGVGIGSQRIAKILKTAIHKSLPDPVPPATENFNWTGHDIRGASVSKLHNAHVDSAIWTVRGRWSSHVTASEHYIKPVTYVNLPSDIRAWALEDILRFDAKRLPVTPAVAQSSPSSSSSAE